jgi:hypothetical protein
MPANSSSPGSIVRMARLNLHCLVPREHPLPGVMRSQLRSIAEGNLGDVCVRQLAPLCPDNDPSIWFIRRLDVEAAVDANWESDRVADALSVPLGRALQRKLNDSSDNAEVLCFCDRTAYLAQFLCDLADGVAWSKWYYDEWQGLRALPANTALREALSRSPAIGEIALLQLVSENRAGKILRTMTTADRRAVLNAFCAAAAETKTIGIVTSHLQAAVRAWQCRNWDDELQIYLTMRQNDSTLPPSAGLLLAIRALITLSRWMKSSHADRLVSALRNGETAAVFSLIRGDDIETLTALLRCDRSVVIEIAEQLQSARQSDADSTSPKTGEPLFTEFGGVFRLLPQLDDDVLTECAAALPKFAGDAPTSLVRFLILLKCFGRQRAARAFFDPLIREIAGVPSGVNADEIRAWAREVTPEMAGDFQARWAASCQRSGAIRSRWLCVRGARRGRLLVVADGERNLWLRAVRSLDELTQAVQSIHESRFTDHESPLPLLCDPALVSMLSANLAGVTVLAWNSPEAVQLAAEDSALATCLARARSPDEDLNYLSLISLLRGVRHFDLALSLIARAVLRGFAWRLPGFAWSSAGYLYENFLDVAATIQPEADRWIVQLQRAPLHIVLAMTGAAQDEYSLPWLKQRKVRLTPADA